MTKESAATSVVMEFVYDQVPTRLLQAYELLASLDYPVPDQKSLEQALQQYDQEENEAVVEMIRDSLQPVDFGLDSPRGALEKFTARLERQPLNLFPQGPFPVPDEPDPRPPEDPFFGSDACGRAARQLYEEVLDDLRGFPGANRAAYNEAERFVGRCRARIPDFGSGRCDNAAAQAWANCYAEGRSFRLCNWQAQIARWTCEASRRRFPRDPFRDPVGPFPLEP